MKIYNSFSEIDFELKKLNLERKIALEEIKYTGNKIQGNLTPNGWVIPILNAVKKFGIYFFLKKILKK